MTIVLLRLNRLGQRKLPIVISLLRMLRFGRVCASPCALSVSAALQGAYNSAVANIAAINTKQQGGANNEKLKLETLVRSVGANL